MSKLKKLFKDSESLTPGVGIWNEIEAKLGLASQSAQQHYSLWEKPSVRLAASVTLFAGLVGLGLMLRLSLKAPEVAHVLSTREAKTLPINVTQTLPVNIVVDSELIVWNADLGEVDLQSEEEMELSDKVFEKLDGFDSKSEIVN